MPKLPSTAQFGYKLLGLKSFVLTKQRTLNGCINETTTTPE